MDLRELTVARLIEELQKLPGDMPAVVANEDASKWCNLVGVDVLQVVRTKNHAHLFDTFDAKKGGTPVTAVCISGLQFDDQE